MMKMIKMSIPTLGKNEDFGYGSAVVGGLFSDYPTRRTTSILALAGKAA
jgi:hypothetical protein